MAARVCELQAIKDKEAATAADSTSKRGVIHRFGRDAVPRWTESDRAARDDSAGDAKDSL